MSHQTAGHWHVWLHWWLLRLKGLGSIIPIVCVTIQTTSRRWGCIKHRKLVGTNFPSSTLTMRRIEVSSLETSSPSQSIHQLIQLHIIHWQLTICWKECSVPLLWMKSQTIEQNICLSGVAALRIWSNWSRCSHWAVSGSSSSPTWCEFGSHFPEVQTFVPTFCKPALNQGYAGFPPKSYEYLSIDEQEIL